MKNFLLSRFHLICCITSILVMILSFTIFFTFIYYTKKLSRLSLLIIYKYIFIFLVYLLHLLYSINNLLNKDFSYSTKVISCFYLSHMFVLQLAINIQHYVNLRNPCYILKNVFKNEFIIFLFILIIFLSSILIAIFPYFSQNDILSIIDYIFQENDENYFDIYFHDNRILSPLIIIIFGGLLYLFFQTRNFYRNLKEKSLEHLKYTNATFFVINIIYLLYGFLLFLSNFFLLK